METETRKIPTKPETNDLTTTTAKKKEPVGNTAVNGVGFSPTVVAVR